MKGAGVVIAGGGLAAQRTAETLRRRGFEGPVRMVCAEDEPPYDRPPLSKQALAGTAADSLAYRSPDWYAEAEVELLLGARAVGVDPAARRLTLAGGERLPYESLVVATGGEPRRLPFLDHENVHALRSLADLRRLRAELRPGARLAIVGAGFIGLEVAATAAGLGAEVTVVEALPTPLEPIVGPRLGRWFAELHAAHGVRLLGGATLESGRGGTRVEELVLAGGRRVGCDLVLVGIGTVPATGWLRGAGLGEGGVRIDAAGRSAVPGVYAAGDACLAFDPRRGAHARTEHWDAAAWQGAAAAGAILGAAPRQPPLPSFWSDQHGVRIQSVGYPQLADAVRIDGNPGERDFEAIFTRAGVAVAGLAVARPRAIPALRKRIEAGLGAAPEPREKERA